jgi:hypothetical protein
VVGSYTQTAGAISGSDAGNYTFAGTTSGSNYLITPRTITGTIGGGSSIYASGLAPGTVSLTGTIASDLVSSTASVNTGATSTSGNFVVGSYTQTASAISGSDAGNYTFAGTTSGSNYLITPRTITGAIGGGSSIYASGLAPGTVTLTGTIASDLVSSTASVNTGATSTSGNFIVGSYTQTATGIAGSDAGNYTFTAGTTSGSNYLITPRTITGTIGGGSSIYASTLAPGTVTLSSVASDLVSSTASVNTGATSTSGNFVVGSYTQTAGAISGSDAGNYTFAGTTSGSTYLITPRTITGTIGGGSSIYASTLAPGSVTLTGVIGGDLVSSTASVNTGATSTSGNFVVGSYTQTASAISGSDAGNYAFAGTTSGSNYLITQRPLTASIAAGTNVYASPLAPGGVGLIGVIGADVVTSAASVNTTTLSGGGHPIVGTYTQSAGAIGGSDAANYSFPGFTSAANYSVTRLGSVMFTNGGGDGLWSNPANWAGTAIPDYANVADVNLGGFAVTFDPGVTGLAGSVQVNNVSGGSLIVGNNVLAVAQSMGVTGYSQNTGTVNITQNLSVTAPGPMSKTGGTLTVGGTTTINTPGQAITATGGTTDFVGPVSLTGTTAQITDNNSLTLGTLNVSSLNVTSSGALSLGTGSVGAGGLVANSNGGNISQSGPLLITGTSNITSGAGSIILGNASNDFGGGVTASSSAGPITFVDQNTFTPTNITNTGTGLITLTANSLAGGTVAGAGTADLSSNTDVTGLVLNFPTVTKNTHVNLLGSATQWTLTGTIPTSGDSFGAASGVGVTINGVTVQAGSLQRQSESVISAAQASATAAAADEAANTFGTDSVAEQIEYGFAGDVGVLPPIDHRLQGVGISVPKCFNESREGEGC